MTTGYLTMNDLIALKLMADKALINTVRIKDLIATDLQSPLKLRMAQGANYFDGKHDILSTVRYYFIDGEKQEAKAQSNNTVPHPFHRVLVNQKAAYIAGNPIKVSVSTDENGDTTTENEQFETSLMEVLGEKFDDIMNDWIIGASNKAIEWIHFYIDPNGMLQYIICPSEQIIPVYDTQYQDELIYVIRYYIYDLVGEQGDTLKRYKVEFWSKTDVEYFVETETGSFIHDPDYELNPAPHWTSFNTTNPEKKFSNSWGRVPFVGLWNNSQLHTDLQAIKPLIDAYDKVKSGWLNDIDDFQEMIYVLKGFAGLSGEAQTGLSELGMFMKNLKENKVISVDAEGGVDTLKAEIPVEAKKQFLEITRREIFYFGEGVDLDTERFGGDPSGISLKFLYSALDLKANRLIRKLKAALKEFMYFTVYYINLRDKKSYDTTLVTYTINKSVIFNEKEKVDMVMASKDLISRKTQLENHPLVTDVEEELARLDEEEAENDVEPSEPTAEELAMMTPEERAVAEKNLASNRSTER